MTDIRTYLLSRIERADYRGEHLAQHNRFSLEKVTALLSAIFAEAGEGVFPIPLGSDRGVRVRGFRKFYRMVDRGQKKSGARQGQFAQKKPLPRFCADGFFGSFRQRRRGFTVQRPALDFWRETDRRRARLDSRRKPARKIPLVFGGGGTPDR